MMNLFTQYLNPYLGDLLSKIKMDKNFVRGEGCYLYDQEQNKYLDFIAAYGALPFGYNNKEIWDCIREFHISGEPSFVQPSAMEAAGTLAKRLIEISPQGLDFVTFTNSGAEAAEAAVKMCRSATGRLGILSTIKGFHGKTMGALSATGTKSYQQAFGAPIEHFSHIEFGNIEALKYALERKPDYYAAFFVEPIQGEGGIVVPTTGYLKDVKEICSRYGVKLVVDEIQSGLGRTGSMFVCDSENVTPDILLVAKALGGGIMPIGACISNEGTYNEEFARKHSSTFAGNSLACRVGLKSIELLTKNNSELLRAVSRTGLLLKTKLEEIQRLYPQQIKSVRGKGLMLGLEFETSRKHVPGRLLGIIAEQDMLTPLISSYLLNVHGLRVAPTLSGSDIIRIEPPLVISESECETAVEAIEHLSGVLHSGSAAKFLSFLAETQVPATYSYTKPEVEPSEVVPTDDAGRFAFLVHPLSLKNYCEFDESLYDLDEDSLQCITDKFSDIAEPFVVSSVKIQSNNGSLAIGDFIGISKTADQMLSLPRDKVLTDLKKAICIARERGAKIVGLGAYTSVVSMGGLYLKDFDMPLTTGNSYTVVSAVDAVQLAARDLGYNLLELKASVLGATGSIGRGVAVVLAEKVSHLTLIGNALNKKVSFDKLLQVVAEICKHASNLIKTKEQINIASVIHKISICDRLPSTESDMDKFLDFALYILEKGSIVAISTSLDDSLVNSDIIVSATSSTSTIISSQHLKTNAIVCDVSRPKNIDINVEIERPDVLVIDGGVIKVPGLPEFGWNFGLEKGHAYACMAETIMLAMEKHYQNTSIGSSGVTIESVFHLRKLAQKHGFEINALKSYDLPLSLTKFRQAKGTEETHAIL